MTNGRDDRELITKYTDVLDKSKHSLRTIHDARLHCGIVQLPATLIGWEGDDKNIIVVMSMQVNLPMYTTSCTTVFMVVYI